MDDRDQKRSFSRKKESFPTIPSGRTTLSTSSETVTPERPISGIQRQTSYRHAPCPPSIERPKRQRPNSGHSYTSLDEEIKPQRPGSDQKLTTDVFDMTASGHACLASELEDKETRYKLEMLYEKEKRDVEQLKSSSKQQFGIESTPTPNLRSCCSEMVANRPPTHVAIDAKAERKRKRLETKEREAKKIEEESQKEQDELERERMMTELSRNRSMFNGNRETLPVIGKKTAEGHFYTCTGKLPKIQEHEITGPSLPNNNAVDVIKKHDAQVRTTAFVKKITHDYINSSAGLMKPYNVNEAIGVIEKHEKEVGRKHAMYTGSYPTGSCTAACQSASARSRCPSGVSRWMAA